MTKKNIKKISQTPLLKELEFYTKKKDGLIVHHLGQFVLIKNQKIVGTFPTEQEAYRVGLEKFGNVPFLIKQVLKEEPIVSQPALTLGLTNVSL